MLKFDLTIKKKAKFRNCIWISKLDLNKDQNLSFVFYFLKNWKQKNRFVFMGSLGDVTDQRSVWAQKNFLEKRTEIHFSIFIENRNWDLKFVFQFDNENEKWKKLKFLFHFKTKIECLFRPTDLTTSNIISNFHF